MLLPTTLTLLVLSALASAAKLTISIAPSPLLPNPGTLLPSTHAVLLGPPGTTHRAPLRTDNSFRFPRLSSGSYLLTLHSRDNFFAPYRVDVAADETIEVWQTFRGNEWSHKGPSLGRGKGEVDVNVRAAGEKQHYQTRGGFDLLGFLKSPMILMGVFSMAMIFGLPYLMANSKSAMFALGVTCRLEAMLMRLQWTRRPRPSSRRCRRRTQSPRIALRVRYRTLILLAGWLVAVLPRAAAATVQGARNGSSSRTMNGDDYADSSMTALQKILGRFDALQARYGSHVTRS